ncbi:MAG: NifB/NifX family molybdenum-iron cluster-binding protein [Spirochaetales bacterium]|nr:NifB/NifX family molybdenum-iron cluster-binding protein [Spirochaetales bacterium]
MSNIDTRAAFPTNDKETVSAHFGHCKYFAVYNISEGKVIETEYLDAPKHAPGVLPKYLADHNVNVIIAGGMGAMAKDLFSQNSIEVIMGADGRLEDNLNTYLGGELYSKGTVCDHNHNDDDHNCDH